MNYDTLTKAEAEAKRFLAKCKEIRIGKDLDGITGSKRVSAVKRASLDLTRALADMRRPG